MNMKKYIIILVSVIIASCGNKGNVLKGKFVNGEGKTVFLERFENNFPVKVDSAIITGEGNFELHFPNKVDLYRVRIDMNDRAILILDSTDQPTIEADANQILATYVISGSENSELIHDFFKHANEHLFEREQFRDQLALVPLEDSVRRDSILAKVEISKAKYAEYRKKFVDDHPSSPALIVTIDQFDYINELDYLRKIEAAMAVSMPNSEYHKFAKTTLSQVETQLQFIEMQKEQEARTTNLLKPGTPAPEIALNNPQDQLVKLSSLRGKIVLIDFWASWCGPCRQENPNVVRLYEKYHSKGFDIYSVSLDKDKEKWIKAIEKDGLVWSSHVSDLMMWNSSVVPLYGINAIPFTVLIDKQGNVITTNLRGPELASKLEELLGA